MLHDVKTRFRSSSGALVVLGLALLALLTRLPLRTTALYSWDAVLYARALEHFDVRVEQPHPPGYVGYVALAKLLQALVGESNTALVMVSVLGATVAVAMTVVLGRRLFGSGVGVAAGAILVTSPAFWFYSGVAYPYTVLAAFSVTLALLWLSVWRGRLNPALVAFLHGLTGGFRLDLWPFLFPLALAAAAPAFAGRVATSARGALRSWGALAGCFALGALTWLVPTALLSGGPLAYASVLLNAMSNVVRMYSVPSRGAAGLAVNAREVVAAVEAGLGVALWAVAYLLARQLVVLVHSWGGSADGGVRGTTAPPGSAGAPHRSAGPSTPGGPSAYRFLLVWILPALLFYLFVHIGERGYVLSVLPGLALLAGRGLELAAGDVVRLGARWWPALLGRGRALVALVGGVAMVNALQFLGGAGTVSAQELRCFGPVLEQSVATVRHRFDPKDTAVLAGAWYQHARYYLPEYVAWRYESTRLAFEREVPPEVRFVVLLGHDLPADPQEEAVVFELPCERRLVALSVRPGEEVTYQAGRSPVTARPR